MTAIPSIASQTVLLLDSIIDDKTRLMKYRADVGEKTAIQQIQDKLLAHTDDGDMRIDLHA